MTPGQMFSLGLLLVAAVCLLEAASEPNFEEQASTLAALGYPPSVVQQVRARQAQVDLYTGCISDKVSLNDESGWKARLDLNGMPICLSPGKDGIKLLAKADQPK